MRHGYRLIAKKAGKKLILAEYRGDDYGLYDFNIERFEIKHSGDQCCGDEEMSSDGEACCGSTECNCKP